MKQCPKCQKPLQETGEMCPHCGIYFEKYFKYHPSASETRSPPADSRNSQLDESHAFNSISLPMRLALLLSLIVWSYKLITPPIASNATGNSFLHLINLPFHEAGHVIFRPFGEFITSLGGSLGQLLMPLTCALVLYFKTRDPFGAAIASWWFGENFLDIAPYMDDAGSGNLPLLGGNFGHSSPYGFHDWQYLLTETGWLRYDHLFAGWVFALGSLIMLQALAWAALLLYRSYKAPLIAPN